VGIEGGERDRHAGLRESCGVLECGAERLELRDVGFAEPGSRCSEVTPARDREALDVTLTEPEPGARKSEAGR
jgi:hypothetical protein